MNKNRKTFESITKPLPCFCGTVPDVFTAQGFLWVECLGCGRMSCTTLISDEKQDSQKEIDAVSLWNKENRGLK